MIAQRLSTLTAYCAFASLFYYKRTCEMHGVAREQSISMPAFRIILLAGGVLQASNTCLNIAIQQDWIPCLATGSSERLSHLNARLKRVDLSCKLLAPLFVSALSTHIPHVWAASALAIFMFACIISDVLWITVVYRRCPPLASDQARKDDLRLTSRSIFSLARDAATPRNKTSWWSGARHFTEHWSEFFHLPTFFSSLAVALLAMSVLT